MDFLFPGKLLHQPQLKGTAGTLILQDIDSKNEAASSACVEKVMINKKRMVKVERVKNVSRVNEVGRSIPLPVRKTLYENGTLNAKDFPAPFLLTHVSS